MTIHSKQIAALNLAIEALERERRARYAAGEAAYRQGIRGNKFDSEGITGTGLTFAEDDHREYMRYTKAITELEDLIDILQDPGVTVNAETISDVYDVHMVDYAAGLQTEPVRVIELKPRPVQIELPINIRMEVTS